MPKNVLDIEYCSECGTHYTVGTSCGCPIGNDAIIECSVCGNVFPEFSGLGDVCDDCGINGSERVMNVSDLKNYKIKHRYDSLDTAVFIRSSFDPTDAAIYIQFKAESYFDESISLSNLAIANALVTFYGCMPGVRDENAIVIDCYSERESRCGEWYVNNLDSKSDLECDEAALRVSLEPHVLEYLPASGSWNETK